jgi:hypothetical protein
MKRYLLISPVTANKPLFLRKNPSKEQGEVYRKETVKLTPVNAYDISRDVAPYWRYSSSEIADPNAPETTNSRLWRSQGIGAMIERLMWATPCLICNRSLGQRLVVICQAPPGRPRLKGVS